MEVNVIDHVALTVPDDDQATEFFSGVFGATIALEGLQKGEPAIGGPVAETLFGIPPGRSGDC